jgi:peptidoglycan/xylan/chitin deacetylase (PgdA/CDA1 family)
MLIETSWDDGSEQDFKIAELLLRYNLPGTFYIPTNCEILPIDIKKLHDMGFTIGCHTNSHPADLKLLTRQEQYDEILENKNFLEQIIGKKIETFCYPRGRYNKTTIEILKELGFKEARTTNILSYDRTLSPFQKQTSVHAYPNKDKYKGIPWVDVSKNLYDLAKASDGCFHIWGHGWEIEMFDEWVNLEKVFKYISGIMKTI